MLKIFILAPVCLALSACMLYAPTYESKTHTTVVHYETTSTVDSHDSTVKQKTTEVSKRVESKAPAPIKRPKLADCKAFTLPREAAPARFSEESFNKAVDNDQLDLLLITQINELQTYIDSMHSKIEQAHLEWLESCKQKLLD